MHSSLPLIYEFLSHTADKNERGSTVYALFIPIENENTGNVSVEHPLFENPNCAVLRHFRLIKKTNRSWISYSVVFVDIHAILCVNQIRAVVD